MKNPIRCGLATIALTIAMQASSPCLSELKKVVKTSHGRITTRDGKPLSGAHVVVEAASREIIFKTKSTQDGTFELEVNPGKYRVEVNAEQYLRFFYVADLRSKSENDVLDVSLQSDNECHDMHIVDEQEERCDSEKVTANLVLETPTVITGLVKDETSAPFENSDIRLTKLDGSIVQSPQLETKTDEKGRFQFEEAEPGTYRLLASPNRGFAQPDKVNCYQRPRCNLEIVLKVNPSEQPYAGCPVK
jgi:5-hydroxyisourate hydrolase-like protein (transthyretin family)